MNIYLLCRHDHGGYDTYDSAVVCAADEDAARMMHPGGGTNDKRTSCWIDPEYVVIELIGKARKNMSVGAVCASFNAG